ncbi:AraC family transcriptional regulator [Roseateles amylovorans]|uniref:AraC family transcriptional regulator n=1 Tax=Roseateles amylovorans TaxID=2978473 RepID=A0ABY6B2Q8_9BURK|nr:AraC family transcriptional regulator [Roseateles amylovorans]UXH78259.1 AraC family transcriptional regulator [Roseateles amylovorans]
MGSLARLVEILSRHATAEGMQRTAIPGVSVVRAQSPTLPMPVLYQPTLCLIAQGRKQVMLGRTAYVYHPAKYLLASIDLPVTGAVIEASEEAPYLSLVLDLNTAELTDLALRHPVEAPRAEPLDEPLDEMPSAGIALNDTTPALLDAAVRLVSLLDTPRDIEALSPLVGREMLYRLLTGPGNHLVRQMAQAESRLNQIAKAVAWLRDHYDEPFRIDDLAEIAGMGRSTFHAHFKAVTSLSPLAFRSQLRLQEARRLMVAEAMDAAGAGFRVGYESPSQFSRDYTRLFGLPPARDAGRLRSAGRRSAN